MPRPTCPRRIEHRPPAHYFKPAGIPLCKIEEIALAADELEAMRLADCEGLYHQDAAKCMGVSRQTFDRIIHRAHQKSAQALVNGFALRIEDTGRSKEGDLIKRPTKSCSTNGRVHN